MKKFVLTGLLILISFSVFAQTRLRDGRVATANIPRNLAPVLFTYTPARNGYLIIDFEADRGVTLSSLEVYAGSQKINPVSERNYLAYWVIAGVTYRIEVTGSSRGKFAILARLDDGRLQRALQREQEQQQQQQQRDAREQAEQQQRDAREAAERAHLHFNAYRFTEAIEEYEKAQGLNSDDSFGRGIQRSIERARELQAKMESYNRPLRDEDFDVQQNPDNTITITGYKGIEQIRSYVSNKDGMRDITQYFGIRNVEIPELLYGLPVTVIGGGDFGGAFYQKMLISVVIPAGVRSIGHIAFGGNTSLTEIVIPDSVIEIGRAAFIGTGLTSVTLGRGLKTIGENAFADSKIQSIVIPNGVEMIGGGAFSGNPLAELVIPASLSQGRIVTATRYGGSTFPNTLTRVTLPANMHDVNLQAFEESLRNFYISQNRAAGRYVKNGPIWTRQ